MSESCRFDGQENEDTQIEIGCYLFCFFVLKIKYSLGR